VIHSTEGAFPLSLSGVHSRAGIEEFGLLVPDHLDASLLKLRQQIGPRGGTPHTYLGERWKVQKGRYVHQRS
jgi:hypothetical protein